MNLQPISNHIIIQPLEDEKTTASGIMLPDNAKEKPQRGKIIAVGPGKRIESGAVAPMTVKVGDTVLFKKYGPDEFEIDGEKYLIGDEEDVLAVFV
jgi:chaperonin GroES